jgi:hypothetical protein
MNCSQIRGLLPDIAAGMASQTHEVATHVTSCAACAAKLQGLRQTMALLDEWRVPEPSPYFDTRVNARVREEMRRPVPAWHWVRRPALALSFAAAVVAATFLVSSRSYFVQIESINTKPPEIQVPAQPGTAVGDLQALEKNHDLYADFDVLDELQVQDDVTANP